MLRRLLLTVTVTGAVALGAGGCLSVGGSGAPAVEKVHALDSAQLTTSQGGGGPALSVRSFSARRRFDDRVVRREPGGGVVMSETERWAESPADAVTDAVREALAQSGSFAGVFPATGGYVAALTLEGYVLACDLVRTPSGPWKALFRVRLDIGNVKTGVLVTSGVFEGLADLPGAASEGLGPAMGTAIGKAMDAAVADWKLRGVLSGK